MQLVTPAFLAGARQQAEDCDLHPATLRGQLRWWWRTLHVGHVPLDELRRLEKLVWGGIRQGDRKEDGRGSAISIRIDRLIIGTPQEYDKNAAARTFTTLKIKENLGLFYASYGMDEEIENKITRRMERRQRHFISEGARWHTTLLARPAGIGNDQEIPAIEILRQAQSALWLLTRYGGIGSKARKGFGSLHDIMIDSIPDIKTCMAAAKNFRILCKAKSGRVDDAMAIEDAKFLEKAVLADNIWKALSDTGDELRGLAMSLDITGANGRRRDKRDRVTLGLPRGDQHVEKGNRHASPVWWHLVKEEPGKFQLRITGFPAFHLPDIQKSREMLRKLADRFPRQIVAAPSLPNPGSTVNATLLEEKTKKGGWRARITSLAVV